MAVIITKPFLNLMANKNTFNCVHEEIYKYGEN